MARSAFVAAQNRAKADAPNENASVASVLTAMYADLEEELERAVAE